MIDIPAGLSQEDMARRFNQTGSLGVITAFRNEGKFAKISLDLPKIINVTFNYSSLCWVRKFSLGWKVNKRYHIYTMNAYPRSIFSNSSLTYTPSAELNMVDYRFLEPYITNGTRLLVNFTSYGKIQNTCDMRCSECLSYETYSLFR